MGNFSGSELQRVSRERDFYRRLLDLGSREELEPFLEEALELIMEMTHAERGYLEVRDPAGEPESDWSLSRSMKPQHVDRARERISRGIIAEALATGETVVTTSALLDSRFSQQESVQAGRVEAVICAPVGARPGLGAVYLEGREGAGPFSEEHQEFVEILARHLAPLADRLLARARVEAFEDATARLREQYQLGEVIGRSPAIAAVLKQAMLSAPLDVNVLLTGDSGTGKTQLGRTIHNNSSRANGPFVEVNCAALPEALIESELFGAKSGAHSSAVRDIQGKVAAADGGTLMLDEIGDLPLAAQAKLLQLLQSREYYPLGSARTSKADIRVIAATNRDLESLVQRRLFREDLYFRLHVLPIRLPSLAERREDIEKLARHYCARATSRNRLPDLTLTTESIRALEVAEWPGNIRQLEAIIEAASIRAVGDGSSEIRRHHLFPEKHFAHARDHDDLEFSFQQATRRFQQNLLRRSLESTDWNVSETARRLDLARSHVYKLMEAFGVKRG